MKRALLVVMLAMLTALLVPAIVYARGGGGEGHFGGNHMGSMSGAARGFGGGSVRESGPIVRGNGGSRVMRENESGPIFRGNGERRVFRGNENSPIFRGDENGPIVREHPGRIESQRLFDNDRPRSLGNREFLENHEFNEGEFPRNNEVFENRRFNNEEFMENRIIGRDWDNDGDIDGPRILVEPGPRAFDWWQDSRDMDRF